MGPQHFPLHVISPTHTTTVGRFCVSSLSKQLDDGRYRASVSIRSGRGSASTDRVMRFEPAFDNEAAAHAYAHAQGLIWVAGSTPLPSPGLPGQPAAHLSGPP